jgi:integrase/recombinase XerD
MTRQVYLFGLIRNIDQIVVPSGGDLEQIQLLLGHASIQTTKRHLGTEQNLATAVYDALELDVG